jgi:sec-independent protein translocase protein TatA
MGKEQVMDIGIPELLIILVVVLILFGPGRIGKTAGELGKGIRAFRDGLSGKDEEKPDEASKAPKPAAPPPPTTEPK